MPSRRSRRTRNERTLGSQERSKVDSKVRKPDKPKKRSTVLIDDDDGTQVDDEVRPKKARGNTKTARRTELEDSASREQLKNFCDATKTTGIQGLLQQFQTLKMTTQTATAPMTAFQANPDKNRYRDVYCVDATRVNLDWPSPSYAGGPYIHANWVKFKGEKKFICTQGPLAKTVDEFWRMIWQEKCKGIIMLCECIEMGKNKCEPYWPMEPKSTKTTESGLQIMNRAVQPLEEWMTVTKLQVTVGGTGSSLDVSHIKWNRWPDRGVPETTMAPFRLLSRIKTLERCVIHCSAGIGRTGTIVGLSMAKQVLEAGESLSLLEVARELRANRHGSIQTDLQYLYMHRCLLDLAERKKILTGKEIAAFVADYDALLASRGG